MNERIKELVIQTDIWCDQNISQGSPAYNNLWENKFAELIVAECCVALSPVLRDMISRGQGVDLIKQHFGVEE